MALFVVTAVRFGENGEVVRVRWARADGVANKFEEKLHEVEVDRVVEAFDRGDIVEMTFERTHGSVSGGRLIRKVQAGGTEIIQEEHTQPGRTLHDLPSF
jgi:hypothetical protein